MKIVTTMAATVADESILDTARAERPVWLIKVSRWTGNAHDVFILGRLDPWLFIFLSAEH